MRQGSAERGFTLLELMVVVAIIAVLAAVVVPAFTRESRKTKSSTEVVPMFTELANREQQYKQESGVFLTAAACPPSPSKALQDINTSAGGNCLATGSAWNTLRVIPHSNQLRCSYQITMGTGATDPSTTAPLSSATWVATKTTIPTSQAESWFYLYARCNADGDSTYAEFFQSSWDTRMVSYNEDE